MAKRKNNTPTPKPQRWKIANYVTGEELKHPTFDSIEAAFAHMKEHYGPDWHCIPVEYQWVSAGAHGKVWK